jgi:iron complex transport system substrate-binding protein
MDAFSIYGTVKAPSQRIISLAPSITEMLFYLGMGDSVVGVTRQCDYPAAASDIDIIGSFLIPDKECILGLSPDVIIGISSLHQHMPETARNEHTGVILFDYHSVQGILDVMEAVSSLAVAAKTALELTASLRNRVSALKANENKDRLVRTLFLISESPIMTPARNSYQYDALRIAGAAQLAGGYTQYERVTLEEVVYFDPEVILACGRHRGDEPSKMCPDCQATQPICQRIVDDIALKPGWKETSAALNSGIVAIPCPWLCRPGPRLITGMESIAEILGRYKRD